MYGIFYISMSCYILYITGLGKFYLKGKMVNILGLWDIGTVLSLLMPL